MLTFSKFFTPAFSVSDRRQLISALGFANFPFAYHERMGDVLLKHALVSGATHAESLSEPSSDARAIERSRAAVDLVEATVERPQTLWEEIFPEPLRSLAAAFMEETAEYSFTPGSFGDELQLLWKSFQQLENRTGDSEVFCLWIRGAEAALPVLVHSVRRKRIRIGTAPYLMVLEQEFLAGNLTPVHLRQFFGTSAGFLYIDTRVDDWSPARIGSLLIEALAGKAPGLVVPASDTAFPEIEL